MRSNYNEKATQTSTHYASSQYHLEASQSLVAITRNGVPTTRSQTLTKGNVDI